MRCFVFPALRLLCLACLLSLLFLPAWAEDGALRISFSRDTTREDIDALCDALRDAKQSLFPSLH